VPKRWLRYENESLLISLLKARKIEFPIQQPPRHLYLATLSMAVDLLIDPRVSLDYALALLDRWIGLAATTRISALIIMALIKRPGVTESMLTQITWFRNFRISNSWKAKISDVAFESRNPAVICWALDNEYIPSAEQLQKLFEDGYNGLFKFRS
jgi:hypothetical protein